MNGPWRWRLYLLAAAPGLAWVDLCALVFGVKIRRTHEEIPRCRR